MSQESSSHNSDKRKFTNQLNLLIAKEPKSVSPQPAFRRTRTSDNQNKKCGGGQSSMFYMQNLQFHDDALNISAINKKNDTNSPH